MLAGFVYIYIYVRTLCTALATMETVHTEKRHFERLNSLCRVCGGRSKRCAETTVKSCALVALELQAFHSIDIALDRRETHSETVCTKCYTRLSKLKYSATPSSTTLKNAKAQIERAANLWVEFDASQFPLSGCPVCLQFVNQKKGGRPVKTGGRPKSKKHDPSVVPSAATATSIR